MYRPMARIKKEEEKGNTLNLVCCDTIFAKQKRHLPAEWMRNDLLMDFILLNWFFRSLCCTCAAGWASCFSYSLNWRGRLFFRWLVLTRLCECQHLFSYCYVFFHRRKYWGGQKYWRKEVAITDKIIGVSQLLGMYRVQFFTGYRVPGIKTVFYRVQVPSTGYLTN